MPLAAQPPSNGHRALRTQLDGRQTHMTDTAAPISQTERITNLDTIRGFATLGILVMNAISFGLPRPAYFNID